MVYNLKLVFRPESYHWKDQYVESIEVTCSNAVLEDAFKDMNALLNSNLYAKFQLKLSKVGFLENQVSEV